MEALFSTFNTKRVHYFNNIKDTVLTGFNKDFEPLIQQNDILQITVSSMNPEDVIIYNALNTTGGAGISIGSKASQGYLQSNNIVYVEPNNAKVASADRTQQLRPIVLSGFNDAMLRKVEKHFFNIATFLEEWDQ